MRDSLAVTSAPSYAPLVPNPASEIVSLAYWTELFTPPQSRPEKELRSFFASLAETTEYRSYRALPPGGAVMSAEDPAQGAERESYLAVLPDRITVKELRSEGVSLDLFQERVEQAIAGSSKILGLGAFLCQKACVQALIHQGRHKLAVEYVAGDVLKLDAKRLSEHLGSVVRMVGLRCLTQPSEPEPEKPPVPQFDIQIESSLQSPPYVWISATGTFPGPIAGGEPQGILGNVRAVYEFVEGRVVPFVLGRPANPPPATQE